MLLSVAVAKNICRELPVSKSVESEAAIGYNAYRTNCAPKGAKNILNGENYGF